MKIAIVTDSNSGITQAQAKELGVSVLPMPFMINDETYYEDITLTQEQFYEKLKNDANISTSQPSPEDVMNLWSELLKDYDEIVHIPMSSSLSGSCQTAMMLAEEFDGNVQVVDKRNQREAGRDKRRQHYLYYGRYVKVLKERRKNYSGSCGFGNPSAY